MTKRKPKSEHKKDGRPTVMTPEVLGKLEDAFMNAFTDEMACLYAAVSTTALYDYCIENPKFAERKEELKQTPNLVAQKTLVGDLDKVGGARWWAEHKMPEFMPKSKVDVGIPSLLDGSTDEAAREVVKKFEEELRATIAAGVRAK